MAKEEANGSTIDHLHRSVFFFWKLVWSSPILTSWSTVACSANATCEILTSAMTLISFFKNNIRFSFSVLSNSLWLPAVNCCCFVVWGGRVEKTSVTQSTGQGYLIGGTDGPAYNQCQKKNTLICLEKKVSFDRRNLAVSINAWLFLYYYVKLLQ